jgi:undecaprenyl-diphosphatase
MLKKLLEWDKEIFVYLNTLGIEEYDTFWTVATEIISWTPVFILFFVLIKMAYPGKEGNYKAFTVLLLLLFVLLATNLTKGFFERLRPNNNEQLRDLIRILSNPKSFSFFSGHAATSFAITTLVYLFLRRKMRFSWLFYLWPLIFSFSRIYVGVHYPFDILIGSCVGIFFALLFYRLYQRFIPPYLNSGHL